MKSIKLPELTSLFFTSSSNAKNNFFNRLNAFVSYNYTEHRRLQVLILLLYFDSRFLQYYINYSEEQLLSWNYHKN